MNEELVKLRTLTTRYREILELALPKTKVRSIANPQASPAHLKWMMDEIDTNDTQSLTKKHRWLSWVSACLILSYKATTVDLERDATRDILKGS